VLGGSLAVFGEAADARTASTKSQAAAAATSAQIASTLKLVVQNEGDLVVNAAAFFVSQPHATQAQFSQWATAVDAFHRYPELEAISEVTMVTPSQLSSFAAADAPGGSGPQIGVPLVVSPPGLRPYYCLGTVWAVRGKTPSQASVIPPGIDYCRTSAGPWLLRIRDSGKGAVLPYGTGKGATLGVAWPIYQGGVVPTTVQGRQDAFIGWVAEELDPSVALRTALVGHHQTAVRMRFIGESTPVTFSAGSAPAGSQTTVVAIGNGWEVLTTTPVRSASILGSGPAVARLTTGILISLVLGLLLYLLGTSRARALAMVEASTAELRHRALHDALTGLPNRALILDRIEQMIARSHRWGLPIAVFFLDLDNFKDVNDTLGHGAGDQMLVEVGARLSTTLREGDTVGRLGGDEFVVLAEGASLAEGLDAVADRILDALSAPFDLDESDAPQWVTVSIGIAEGARDTAEELLQDADVALYEAKTSGKQHAVVFSPSMQEALDDRRRLENDLHGALEAGQFVVRYRATTELASRRETGVEARLSWHHPERGVVPPTTFEPALESTGLMVPVGRWLLQTACRDGVAWHRSGTPLTVSVDITASQFQRVGFVDDVEQALAASGFDPAHLVLALSETALASDGAATIERLHRLKALGVRIALDEFDSGYSSLTFLQRYPIDILTIDRSLVIETVDPGETESLAETLGQLARVFGVEIIIEGPEGEEGREAPAGAEHAAPGGDSPPVVTLSRP
jgi:diguanylate cyclase (GGDEF)-like protein